MSAKQMGIVWELDLPHSELWVLMAMADHADHDGNNVYPSMGYVAWKTGYEVRSVRRIVKKLRDAKILIPVQAWYGHAKRYQIDTSNVPRKAPFQKRIVDGKRGDNLSGVTFCQDDRGVTHNRQVPTNKNRVVGTTDSSREVQNSLSDFEDDYDFDEGEF